MFLHLSVILSTPPDRHPPWQTPSLGRHPPPRRPLHGRYASYWNAFLLTLQVILPRETSFRKKLSTRDTGVKNHFLYMFRSDYYTYFILDTHLCICICVMLYIYFLISSQSHHRITNVVLLIYFFSLSSSRRIILV